MGSPGGALPRMQDAEEPPWQEEPGGHKHEAKNGQRRDRQGAIAQPQVDPLHHQPAHHGSQKVAAASDQGHNHGQQGLLHAKHRLDIEMAQEEGKQAPGHRRGDRGQDQSQPFVAKGI